MNGAVPIYVVRHGATTLNNQTDLSQDRIRGWANVPLANEGHEEARKAAEALKPHGIQVIISSDLTRALETAQIIGQALGVQVEPSQKLRPWNLGDFTGTSTKDALPKIAVFITQTPDQPVPGGESFNQFKERCMAGVAEAIQHAAGRPLCIVTHHRDERLLRAWEAKGEPPTHEIDLDVFLEKGDPPGGVFQMNINPGALAPTSQTAQPAGAQPTVASPAAPPPSGQPPPSPAPTPPPTPPPPNPMLAMMASMQRIQKAIDVLRRDIPRGYRIEIEVDTMVAGDQMQERQDANQFLDAVTKFIMAAGQIVMVNPPFAPLAAKMLQFGVRKFRTGRELESAIDEYADRVSKTMAQQGPKPDPKAQADQMKAQAEIQKAQIDAQSAAANDQRDQQGKQLDLALKTKQHDQEMQMMAMKMQYEQQIQTMKMQLEQMKAAAETRKGAMDEQAAQADHARSQQAADADHRRQQELSAHQHAQKMKSNGADLSAGSSGGQ